MNNKSVNIIFFGVLAFLIQTIFVKNINIFGLINPKIFPIFLLLLPRNIKTVYLMLIGIAYGFLIDVFSTTLGINMAASVFICFIKSYVLDLIYNKSAEEEPMLSSKIQGSNFIFRYLFITLFLYHVAYFFIEIGQFYNFFYTLLKALLSTVLALILYAVFILLFSARTNKKDFKS